MENKMSDDTYARIMMEGTPNNKNPWMLQCARTMANATKILFESKFNKAPKSVLDLGCGVGQYTDILSRSNFDCLGVDKNINFVKWANTRNNNVEYKAIDLFDLKISNKFGIISATHEVFNIIEDYKLFINTFKDNMHEDGFMIFDIITPFGFETWQDIQISERTDFLMVQKCIYRNDNKTGTVKLTGFVQNGIMFERFDVITHVYDHDIQDIFNYAKSLNLNIQFYHEWDDFTKNGNQNFDKKFINMSTKVYCVLSNK